jgi:hypothetical protein
VCLHLFQRDVLPLEVEIAEGEEEEKAREKVCSVMGLKLFQH